MMSRFSGWTGWFPAVLAGLGLVSITVPRLAEEWTAHADYGHVWMLIPLLTVLCVRDAREAASGGAPERGVGSLVLFVLSTVCFFIDWRLREPFFLGLALWFGVMGVCGWCLDAQRAWAIRFYALPALFLVPFPRMVMVQYFHLTLQDIAASSTAGMLSLVGIAANASGTIVAVGEKTLNIEEACSGLKFMTVLVLFALFAGRVLMREMTVRRVILCMASIPLAVVVNSVRLWLAGIILHVWGWPSTDAFLHGWSVLLVYALGFGIFGGLIAGLRSIRIIDEASVTP